MSTETAPVVEPIVEEEAVSLTPAAAQAVKDLLVKRNLEGYALRIFVQGGGCSGIQYGLALEGNIRPEDLAREFDGARLVVDEVSIDYLRGATIDYVETPEGAGFKIENPNFVPTCSSSGCSGCG
jgi:iron-sulfur cluster assembly accessory protein